MGLGGLGLGLDLNLDLRLGLDLGLGHDHLDCIIAGLEDLGDRLAQRVRRLLELHLVGRQGNANAALDL